MHLTTFYAENGNPHRAEVHELKNGYNIEFYGPNGQKLNSAFYKTLSEASMAAEGWIQGLTQLNG